MRNIKSYGDIEIGIEEILDGRSTLDDMFFLEDLKQRKLFLNTEIDQFSIADIVRHIMAYNKEDHGIPVEDRKPIVLYVVSNGGDVDSGFELIDIIQSSKTPVYTVNLGYQYSMGFLIGLAGHKRYTTKNARFLMHDGSMGAIDSMAKLEDRLEFNRRCENRTKEYVLSVSKITEAEYDAKRRVEWYMFAEEAKEKGFVDYIIGVDCDIDDVI